MPSKQTFVQGMVPTIPTVSRGVTRSRRGQQRVVTPCGTRCEPPQYPMGCLDPAKHLHVDVSGLSNGLVATAQRVVNQWGLFRNPHGRCVQYHYEHSVHKGRIVSTADGLRLLTVSEVIAIEAMGVTLSGETTPNTKCATTVSGVRFYPLFVPVTGRIVWMSMNDVRRYALANGVVLSFVNDDGELGAFVLA